MRRIFLLLLGSGTLALAGCGAMPVLPAGELPPRYELEAVPFIAQDQYQCGPAALATVLQASGAVVSAEELVPRVYLPARKGSLQTELIAAARQYDRVPYQLSGELADVLVQVSKGEPVLVLQNLGLKHWPQWHFAVLVGFDVANRELILRSGTNARLTTSMRAFARTWDRGGRWAMLALEPHELPADADAARYMAAAAGLEATGRLHAARTAYETARTAWPDSIWPQLGLANVAYLQGQLGTARALYEQVLARDPANVSARYNLADTFAQLGCSKQAHSQWQHALAAARDPALQTRIKARLAQLTTQAEQGATCR